MLNKVKDIIEELEKKSSEYEKLVVQAENKRETLDSLLSKIKANEDILVGLQKKREEIALSDEKTKSELEEIEKRKLKLDTREKAMTEREIILSDKEKKVEQKLAQVKRIMNG